MDLPALGRPTSATKPAFISPAQAARRRPARSRLHRTRRDSPPLGLDNFDVEAVDLERARRPPARGRGATAGSRPPSRSLCPRSSTFIRFAISSTCDAAAEHELAVAFVDDALDFDVVLVANLADDLFEQIFERHEAGGAAVFVDDDRDLHPLALKLLQQIRARAWSRARSAPAESAA